MKRFLRTTILLIAYSFRLSAQYTDTSGMQRLEEITVHAFEQNTFLSTTPAAINTVSAELLSQYNNAGIIGAVNATPGVRMEERSPGSYRLAIRGSSLRSPFGVRNVKIYYDGIPLTDPGGTTYLNQLGYYNFSSIEILKGPGSSIYGAGTGGVMLINSEPDVWTQGAKTEVTAGSYGMFNIAGEVRLGKKDFHNTIRYQHLTSDGYRDQTAMHRDAFSWDAHSALDVSTSLNAHFLYGDLAYETPGALTLHEYDSAPRMARPRMGASPSAAEAGAVIYQQTALAGFTVNHRFSPHWSNTTALYGVYSQMKNPNIRNYSQTAEPNVGGRSVLTYEGLLRHLRLQWLAGAEFQKNFSTIATYRNVNGQPDTLQTDESVQSIQLFGFTQLNLYLPQGWTLSTGLSLTQLQLNYDLLSKPGYPAQRRNFTKELSPRIALLKKWNRSVSAYGVIARGFSPPTSSEMAPSGSALNLSLAPEQGWNYEIGARGVLLNNRLHYDVSLYYFALNNTIVQRRDAAGGDYYTNSGNTEQAGTELALEYTFIKKEESRFGEASIRAAYTYQHFRYGSFAQLGKDYSRNELPGVPSHTLAAGLVLQSNYGIYLNINYYFSDALPLDDANTAMNAAYHLLGVKVGYEFKVRNRGAVGVFAGGENLTGMHYSAGPDINAFGGRYYNTSPGRSFFGGLSLRYAR